MPDPLAILVSEREGIYVPQAFAERYDLDLWSNIDQDDLRVIEEGPEAEWYWEAWNNILSSAEYRHDGKVWRLYQDGDLWAYCEELMSDEDRKAFFGED